jgi:hypothetical protein
MGMDCPNMASSSVEGLIGPTPEQATTIQGGTQNGYYNQY